MSDSTSTRGNAISEFCKLHAAMLNFDIYDTAEADVPDALKPYVRANRTNWEKHPTVQADDDDGFRCCLYLPRNRGSEGTGACPPVMVFRGSDNEERDIEYLIFGMQANYDFLLDLPWFPGVPDDVAFAGRIDASAGLLPAAFGHSMAQLRNRSELTEEQMFSGVQGTERFNVSIPVLRDGRATLDWSVTTSLFYGESGDWPVNFAQGLGRPPPQYRKAITFGRAAADVAATGEWGNRIIFTGHSLGGGLASAGAIAARQHQPDLTMSAVTYNAAGLHENTAALIPASLSAASDVPIRAMHIHSEILNSMQSTSRIVPFIADLLAWAGKTMPPAVARPIAEVGVSPGPMSIMNFEASDEGQLLPVLFPVRNETLIRSGFPTLGPVITAASAALDLPGFVRDVVAYVIDRISAGDLLHHSEASELQNLSLPNLEGLKAPLVAAVLTGADVPVISLGTSNYVRTIIDPFVNGLIEDLVGLARLFLASGNYHTFLPCAYTFILPRLRQL